MTPRPGLAANSRVARLEAIEDIRTLKSAYDTHINHTQFDQVAALFTDDVYVKLSYLMPGGRPWVGTPSRSKPAGPVTSAITSLTPVRTSPTTPSCGLTRPSDRRHRSALPHREADAGLVAQRAANPAKH